MASIALPSHRCDIRARKVVALLAIALPSVLGESSIAALR
jgi:hypothetical protein